MSKNRNKNKHGGAPAEQSNGPEVNSAVLATGNEADNPSVEREGVEQGEHKLVVADPNLADDSISDEVRALAPNMDGWTPVLAIHEDGERRVLRAEDWKDGEGQKPPVGLYVGIGGYVGYKHEADDISKPVGVASDEENDNE